MKRRRARRYEYILGDSSSEVKRLAHQAGVWRDMTEGLFDRLKVGPGWKCLELGPGTGTVFFPLADRVRGRGGRLDGLERSPVYVDYLRRHAAKPRYSHVRIVPSEILSADLPDDAYDLIFARWVFIFLPDVEKHIKKLIKALKPGGLLAIEDYHRRSVMIYPPIPEWETIMKADAAWFAQHGGDLNIAGKLPTMFRGLGLDVADVHVHQKIGFPGSDVWKWVETYFLGYLDEMAKFKPATPAVKRRFRAGWRAARKNPASLFISPTMLDVVGRKPRRR